MNCEEQEKKAGRDVDHGDGSLDPLGRSRDYVDVDFLMNLMNAQCVNCNEPLTIAFEDGKVSSNISCQRVNNMIEASSRIVIVYTSVCLATVFYQIKDHYKYR